MIYMIKQLAWNTFKETGDIKTYLEFKEVKNIEEKSRARGWKSWRTNL